MFQSCTDRPDRSGPETRRAPSPLLSCPVPFHGGCRDTFRSKRKPRLADRVDISLVVSDTSTSSGPVNKAVKKWGRKYVILEGLLFDIHSEPLFPLSLYQDQDPNDLLSSLCEGDPMCLLKSSVGES